MKDSIDYNVVLPPSWAFGVIYGGYTDQKSTVEKVKRLINEDYPIDAYWIDSCFWDITTKGPKGYINFSGDSQAYPDVASMCQELDALCVRTGIWIWDRLLKDGCEDIFCEFEKKGYFKTIRDFGENWHNGGGTSICGFIDFDNPKAAFLWKMKLKPLFDKGIDFLKLDAAAKLSYIKTGFEATQEMAIHTKGRGFILSHECYTNDQTYNRYPTAWTGDSVPDWSQAHYPAYPPKSHHLHGGLLQNIEMVANPGNPNYRFPFLTNDTGGFSSYNGMEVSDELYMRWVQFSAFNAIMEVFSSMYHKGQNAPYNFDREAQDNFRFYTHLRMRLFPYIYSYAHQSRWFGKKMIQGDGVHLHQYLFGNEFLVAPVYEQGCKEILVYLPEGQWIDYWSGYIYEGKDTITVSTPQNVIPVFVRKGSIIPMREYSRAIELGNNKNLLLDVYPKEGKTSFTLYEDDGLSNDYLSGGYVTTEFVCYKEEKRIEIILFASEGEMKGKLLERRYCVKINGISNCKLVVVNGLHLSKITEFEGVQNSNYAWFEDVQEQKIWIVISTKTKAATKIEIFMV